MDVEKFIEEIGGRAEIIRQTGLSKGRISQWCTDRAIPKPWIMYLREKYPVACERHGIVGSPEERAALPGATSYERGPA